MNTLAKELLDEEKVFTLEDALAFKKLADEQHLHVMLLYAELEENVMKEKAARKLAEELAAFANALAMALEDELATKKDLVEEDDDITFLNSLMQEVSHFVKDQPQPSSHHKRDLSFFDDDDEDEDDISFLPAPKRHSPSPQPQFDNDDDFFLFYVPPQPFCLPPLLVQLNENQPRCLPPLLVQLNENQPRCLPPLLVELNENQPRCLPPLLVELNEDKCLPLEFNPLPILPKVSYSPINVPFDKETMLFDFIVEDSEMDTLINFV
jgi:hypothetical protein